MNPTDINDIVAVYRQNPQALQQKYAMSQDLLDLLALQKITKEKQDAARQMQLQAGQQGTPPPVAQQLEGEALDMTKREMAQQSAGIANQRAGEMQQRMQGIAAMPAPNMAFADGGIVGFNGEQGSYVDSRPLMRAHKKPSSGFFAGLESLGDTIGGQLKRAVLGGAKPETTTAEGGYRDEGRNTTAPETTYTGTRLPPEQEQAIAQKIAAGDNSELADFWAAYKRKFPDAGAPAQRTAPAEPPASSSPTTRTQDLLRVQEDNAGISQKPYLTDDQLVDAAQREALEIDPAAARAAGRKRYAEEVGDAASAAYDARIAEHKKGFEGIQALQQKRLAAGEGIDTRPAWLQQVSAMASAYDKNKAPAGLAGLAAVTSGADAYRASQVKKEQDRAQMELDFANQILKTRQEGWKPEDAKLKVSQEAYDAGEKAETAGVTRKGKAVAEAMDLRQAKARAASTGNSAERAALSGLVSTTRTELANAEAALKQFETTNKLMLVAGKPPPQIAAEYERLKRNRDAAQVQLQQLGDQLARMSGVVMPTSAAPATKSLTYAQAMASAPKTQ